MNSNKKPILNTNSNKNNSNNNKNNSNNNKNNSNNNKNNLNNNKNNSNNNKNNSNNNKNNSNNNNSNNSNNNNSNNSNNNNLNNSNNNNSNNSNNNNLNNSNNKNNLHNNIKNKINNIYNHGIVINKTLNDIPIQLKILNIIIMFIFTYIFTEVYYSLSLSIIFGILTTLTFFILGKYYGIIFLVLYITYIIQIITKENTIFIYPIGKTYINDDGPLDCSLSTNNQILTTETYKTDLGSLNFSYSMWLYVNNNNSLYSNNWKNYRYNEWKSILYAGDREINDKDISSLNQYPGFWMTPQSNNIVITFQTNNNNNRFELMNFPMNKWFNLTCVIERNSVSVYINCKLENNFALLGPPPSISEYNLYIINDSKLSSDNKNGFPGLLGNLSYYDYALNQTQINLICKKYGEQFEKLQNSNKKNCTSSCLITNSNIQ